MQTELTPVQLEILKHLANSFSLGEAAQQVGVDRNTIANWRRAIPAFNRELEQAMRDRALMNQEHLQALVYDAITALRQILQDEEASSSARLRAAQMVFKMTVAKPEAEPVAAPQQAAEPAQEAESVHKLAQRPIRLLAEPGRNSLCPCGSGAKFKRCCANPAPQTTPQTMGAAA
jgi:uncharacterized protein YecA (UPF0149 family)